jgi:hypothetical protein
MVWFGLVQDESFELNGLIFTTWAWWFNGLVQFNLGLYLSEQFDLGLKLSKAAWFVRFDCNYLKPSQIEPNQCISLIMIQNDINLTHLKTKVFIQYNCENGQINFPFIFYLMYIKKWHTSSTSIKLEPCRIPKYFYQIISHSSSCNVKILKYFYHFIC